MTDKLQGLQGQLNELQSQESAQAFINPNYGLEKTLKVKSQDEITKKILHQVRTASAAETKQTTGTSTDKGVSKLPIHRPLGIFWLLETKLFQLSYWIRIEDLVRGLSHANIVSFNKDATNIKLFIGRL